jgi:type IV pilus assembly protein PilY1
MRKHKTSTLHFLALIAVAAILGVPRAGVTQTDDSVLFTTIVPPNVLLLLDNSGSMNHVMWHPAYDDSATPTCTQWSNTSTYFASDENDSNEVLIGSNTFCGNTRTVFSDPGTSASTRWSGRYLNWYFSDAADSYASEIISTSNGSTSDCLGSVVTYGKYRRTRITALRQTMREVTCLINEGRGVSDGIRFGVAQFRDESDPHGGYVSERIDDNTTTHMDAVEADIQALEADAWTPLGESLFHSYLYFMSRSGTSTNRPLGADNSTRFPAYTFRESDGEVDASAAPPDPVEYPCQKNFIIVVTDGEPTKDDFDTTSSNLDVGFSSFGNLIGDFIPGDETEVINDSNETAWYMDDIARFMNERDFRPDMTGDQTIDIYTVGFTTNSVANGFLDRVADEGNGIHFEADDADQLYDSLLGALTDIVEKTTSFTASTVPASRTVDGADFYTSFFLPFGADPFWQGHLQAYHITADGDIVDSAGNCALDDPTTGECNSGPFVSTAVPFWDAGEEIPAPASRNLYTQKLVSGTPTRTDFTTGALAYTDLALSSFAADGNAATAAPNRTYTGTKAVNEEGLADEIIQYERGCEFGTGVTSTDVTGGVACAARSWRLADIFHSNPIVVGKPGAFITETSYQAFKAAYATRDRIIYAGSNGGFVHGFHAGDWDASATPPAYDEGTGTEVFGFMPAYVRQTIKYQPEPNTTSEHYYVDGSPDAADVWHHPTPTTTSKATNGSEWKSMLVGGLRQGGESYYALDVTNPAASGYPGFLWEFPVEGTTTYTAHMGETWGNPVVTRVKLKLGTDDNSGAGYERWVVIVTAGYDESGDPNLGSYVNTTAATKGRAIFMLDAKTGAVIAMESLAGRTDSSVTSTTTESYALASTPAVLDTTFDGYADLVYVGDLGGNLWKWVIHEIGDDRVNDSSGLVTQPEWTFRKIFEAPEDVDGGATYYKSIFYPPSATLYRGKLYLAFASGERTDLGFEGPTDTTDDNNRFWVMTDIDPYEKLGTPQAVVTESDLTDVTSDETCQSITTRGFFFTVDNGEKFVTNSEIFARNVIVASFTPTDLTDPCESGGGQTSLYVFDILCSEGFFDNSGDPDREFDLGAGFPTDPRISAGPDGKKNVVFIEKSRAEVESIFADDINAAGSLLYWRELP